MGCERSDRVHRASQVDVDGGIPILVLHLQDRLEALNAGIGEENVESAEGRHDVVRRTTQGADIALVRLDREPSASLSHHLATGLFEVGIVRGFEVEPFTDICADVDADDRFDAGARHRDARGPAYAARGTGDDGDFPVESPLCLA